MTDIAALKALLEKVKAGFDRPTNWRDFAELEKPFRATDQESRAILAHRAFHGDVNAAIAFHKAVRPGWTWMIRKGDEEDGVNRNKYLANIWPEKEEEFAVGEVHPVWANDPARALLIADLESIIIDPETNL